MSVLIFSTNFSENFLILGKAERGTIKNVYWTSYKVEILFSDFQETIIISVDFRRNSNITFNEISQVGADLFDADERTDGQT